MANPDNPVQAELEKLPKERLIELIEMYSRNWHTCDGLWFSADHQYFMSWAAKCAYRVEKADKSALLTVTSCPPQEAGIKAGRGIFACRPTFETGFGNVATVIDRRVKVVCRYCPPGPYPSDSWCEWEFRTVE